MREDKNIIFEYLTLPVLLFLVFKKTFLKNNSKIYFIESSSSLNLNILRIIQNKFKIEKFEFKLIDIKDSRGELIQERIRRKDLYEFERSIIESKSFNNFFKSLRSNPKKLKSFIIQSLVIGSQLERKTIHRFILLLEAMKLSNQISKDLRIEFIIDQRPWFDLYEKWGSKYGIKIKQKFTISMDLTFQSFYPSYVIAKYFLQIFKKDSYIKSTNNNLFIEGRGDINFSNDGYHSDYFWYLNSNFPSRKIITQAKNDFEATYFEENDLSSCRLKFNFRDSLPYNLDFYRAAYFDNEKRELYLSMKRFKTISNYWKSIFMKYDIKTYLTWNKYSEEHIAKSAAIEEVGGISAIWQLAFDGFQVINARYNVDVNYAFSDLSVKTDNIGGSVATYQIITGYPKRYAKDLLSIQAQDIRDNILSNGAKQIIFVIDENSVDDDRWHTGHSLQIENYQKPLEFIMKNNDFGLIFKPKNSKNLRDRLNNDTYDLLSQALKTGRCIILDDLGIRDFTTSAPPMLAAMACDLCIHGHFGTASLEAAFIDKPTIMIDREGTPDHVFYKLFDEDTIFSNWENALRATEEYFYSEKSNLKIGNWSKSIAEFDPFDDDLAAKRIGDHLTEINYGLDEGLNKHESLERAAELYAKRWGADKVIYRKI